MSRHLTVLQALAVSGHGMFSVLSADKSSFMTSEKTYEAQINRNTQNKDNKYFLS